jgi:hypothetical protein
MRDMVRLGRRRERAMVLTAAVCALVITAWFAMGQTRATFSDTTENPNNLLSTGSIELTDNRNGVAMFNVSDLLPGMTVQEEITVINGSPTGLSTKLYTAAFEETVDTSSARTETGLAENLQVMIELVDTAAGVSTGTVFDGTLAQLALATGWDTGHSAALAGDPLTPNGDAGSVRTYRITVTLSASAGLPEQNVQPGDQARITFVWEGRA